MKNTDGLVMQRTHLARILGLEHFKGARVDWLTEDMMFPPHTLSPHGQRSPKSFLSLFVSRVPPDSFSKRADEVIGKRSE